MNIAIEIASAVSLLAGAFFAVVGCLGLVRMPDRYTRMHAASVTDTIGAGLILFGLVSLVMAKYRRVADDDVVDRVKDHVPHGSA